MRNSIPLFTVVIPTYNHAHLIKRCLDSVIQQRFTNWEAIVVNNFSFDNTIEVVESYSDPRIRLINYRNNGVIAVSRNKGITEAKGEWICFLDSDDWWYPNKLIYCKRYLLNHDLIFHDMHIYTAKGKNMLFHRKGCKLSKKPYIDLVINGNPIINSSVIIRKSIIDSVGLLSESENLIGVEDYEFWIRVSTFTSNFCYVPKYLGGYWEGANNLSYGKKQIERVEYLFLKSLDLLPEEIKYEATLRNEYRKGRFFQLLCDLKNAQNCFKKSIKSSNFTIVLKSLVLLRFINVTSYFRKNN